MVIVPMHDLQDALNQSNLLITTCDPVGNFWTPWLHEEFNNNPALYNKIKMMAVHAKFNALFGTFIVNKDSARLLVVASTKEPDAYSDEVLKAFTFLYGNILQQNHKVFPWMDMMDGILDLFPDHPTDKSTAIFLVGSPSEEMMNKIKEAWKDISADVITYEPLKDSKPLEANAFSDYTEDNNVEFLTTNGFFALSTQGGINEQATGDDASQFIGL